MSKATVTCLFTRKAIKTDHVEPTPAPPKDKLVPRFKWEGAKFHETRNMDIAEIAKLIRKEIREKHKGVKCSVRIDRFAGGQAIRVTIKEAPFRCFNPLYDNGTDSGRDWLTPEARALVKSIEAIRAQYNFDDSDGMVDYFHVRYYGSTEIDWALKKAERDEFSKG